MSKGNRRHFNFFATIERIYKDQSLLVLSRAKSLYVANIVLMIFLGLGMLVLLGLQLVGFSNFMFSFIFGSITFVGFVISYIRLIKRHYRSASVINILAIAFGVYYMATIPTQPDATFYRIALYSLFIGLAVVLYGYSHWLFWVTLAVNYIFVGIYCFGFIYPTVPVEGHVSFFRACISSALIYHSAFIFMYNAYLNSSRSFKLVNKHMNEVETNYEKVKELFNSTQKGLEIGENVQQVANNSYIYAKQIDTEIDKMGKEMAQLVQEMDQQKIQQQSLDSAASEVKKTMDDQTSAIIETSAAVLEMTANIREVSGITQEKKTNMDDIINSSSSGARRIEETMGSINRIVVSSQKLLEVLDVIDGISSRTNLLAMNAAIEAAHAGEAGRGFSIVAEEIRKLAEETSSNSNVIKQTLEENISQVQETFGINQEAVAFFEEVNQKVQEFGDALNEIFLGMNEITNGTEEILTSIENIRSGNTSVYNAMEQIDGLVARNHEGLKQVLEVSEQLNKGMSNITGVSSKIVNVSEEILDLGGENLKQLNRLKKGIYE